MHVLSVYRSMRVYYINGVQLCKYRIPKHTKVDMRFLCSQKLKSFLVYEHVVNITMLLDKYTGDFLRIFVGFLSTYYDRQV